MLNFLKQKPPLNLRLTEPISTEPKNLRELIAAAKKAETQAAWATAALHYRSASRLAHLNEEPALLSEELRSAQHRCENNAKTIALAARRRELGLT